MYDEWREYVPVAQRKAQARKHAEKLAKKRGFAVQPLDGIGRKITKTYWGDAWCDNMEGYSDFANRLPRGRTIARNGSIVDLVISKGKVTAIVGGSDVYKITIKFGLLKPKQWKTIKQRSAGSIDSVMSLLQGRFDEMVMADLSRQKEGLFPTPGEIDFSCSCPDGASMCKHVASVFYGIGARLDSKPEMLFQLRGVDHLELIADDAAVDSLIADNTDSSLVGQDLGAMFGIELDGESTNSNPAGRRTSSAKKKAVKATKKVARAKKKPAKKAAPKKAKKSKPAIRKKSATKKTAKKKATARKRPAKRKVTKKASPKKKKTNKKKKPAAKKKSTSKEKK